MASPLPHLPCLCATARRTARAMTGFYDDHLRESGIAVAQFTVLSALHEAPGRSQREIAQMLVFDKTTLSRNLKVLQRNGWIAPAAPAKDRRRQSFALTREGRRRLKAARPRWQKAQAQLHRRLSKTEWAAAWQALATLSDAARRPA